MSNVTFNSVEGFLAWLAQAGNNVEFPFPGGNGWVVQITGGEKPSLEITSPFYAVRRSSQYGAPKIFGHYVEFCGHQASGVIGFGIEDGELKLTNRRRLVETDELGEGQVVVSCNNDAAPDRLEEPIAVVANTADRATIAALSTEVRLAFILSLRDGVEMMAASELFAWADSSD